MIYLIYKWRQPCRLFDLEMKRTKKIKNPNQIDLFEWLAQLEQLRDVESELNMASSLGPSELKTIVEKQVDWVELELLD
jgi:hypothetical protein